jgi:hypothetical protein
VLMFESRRNFETRNWLCLQAATYIGVQTSFM